MVSKKLLFVPLFLVLLVGCMTPVRPAVKLDMSVPVGKIEGNRFTGIRYPFNVSAPPNWVVSFNYPAFLLEQGYEKPGLQQDQLFLYNPATQASFQIDFETADRYTKFTQASIEWMTNGVGGEALSDTKKQAGASDVSLGPTEPVTLKGVQFAAKKYVAYAWKGIKWQQGWIYGFTEPFQIFLLYMIRDQTSDIEDLKKILDSFEVVSKK